MDLASKNYPCILPTSKYVILDLQITVSGGLQQSGVAHQPLFPKDILLFISQGKQRGKKQTVHKPKVPNQCFRLPMVHNFPISKLQFRPAVSFVCGILKGMKAFFSSPDAGRRRRGTVSVVARCGSTERQEASVQCCCCEEGAGRARPAWRLLQLLSHCAQHRAHSVPLMLMSRCHHAALSHAWAYTHSRTCTRLGKLSPFSTATMLVHYCHSFLTKQNSARGRFSAGIIFIFWIVPTVVIIV